MTSVCIIFVWSPKYSGGSVVQFHGEARGERQVEPLSRSHFHGERASDQWECDTSVYVYKLTRAAEGHADKESESRLFKVISNSVRNKKISKDSSRAGARSLISGACSDTKMTPHKLYRDTLCLGSVVFICWSRPQVSTGWNSLILRKLSKIMLLKTTWTKQWGDGRKDTGAIITVYFFRKDIDNTSVRVKPPAVLFLNSICRYKLGFKIPAEGSHRQD